MKRANVDEYAAGSYEFVIDEAENWVAIPNHLLEFTPLLEPLAIAERALHETCHMSDRLPSSWGGNSLRRDSERQRALIVGAGPAGLVAAMSLIEGNFEVFILPQSSITPADRIAADLIGAKIIEDAPAIRGRVLSNLPEFHLLYEASGDARAAFDLMDALAREGIVIFAHSKNWKNLTPPELARVMHNVLLKGQVVFGAVRPSIDSYRDAMHDLGVYLRKWPDAVRAIIHPNPIAQIQSQPARDLEFCQAG